MKYFKFNLFIILALLLGGAPNPAAAAGADFRLSLMPTDAHFAKQWYLEKIDAPAAWELQRNSEDVVVAIIDSGIDTNHPDLRDNIWENQGEIRNNARDDDDNGYVDDVQGWDFVGGDPDVSPSAEDFTEEGRQL